MKKKNAFTIPKLCTCKGDLSKSWYVYFYYTDLYTGEKKLFRYKYLLNSLKTKREREREASEMISVLHERLQNGWNPISEKTESEHEDFTTAQALDNILSIKKSFLTQRSYKTYYDQLNLFKKWLEIRKYDKIFVQNFNINMARQYFDWLLKDKGYCGKTYNGHLGTLRSFFNSMVEREMILKNPVFGIKQVPQERGKNTTYTQDEEKRIEEYMINNELNFFYSTRFVRYCFFRRSELQKLQIKHIIWDNKTIIIPSSNAKSRVQDSITISKTLEKYIIQMGIMKMNPEFYVFGKHFIPSLEKIKRVDDFSDMQRKINNVVGIKKESTFYSWKHTGAVELYNRTKDPYTVMRQCRHSDIKMTMIYLRSLGCGVNEQVREW
jgi:integrase